MSESVRCFLAVDIENPAILSEISSAQKLLLRTGADLRLVKPRNIHITIRFLGETKSTMLENVSREIDKVQFAPFNIRIEGLGVFPNLKYPRIVWVGITEGGDELRKVFSQVEPGMRKLGFHRNHKGFSPHLTIARVRSGRNKERLAEFITKNEEGYFGSMKTDRLRLKKSELTPQGPIYSILKEFISHGQQE